MPKSIALILVPLVAVIACSSSSLTDVQPSATAIGVATLSPTSPDPTLVNAATPTDLPRNTPVATLSSIPVAIATPTNTPELEPTPGPTHTPQPTPTTPSQELTPTTSPIPIPQLGLADASWPMFQGNAQHTGFSSYSGPEIPSINWIFEPGVGTLTSPSIGPDGTLYTGSSDRIIYAVGQDGVGKWDAAAENPLRGTPAISADGTIYFSSYESVAGALDATLYAVDSEGSIDWRFSTEAPEIFPPVIGPDVRFHGFGDQRSWYDGLVVFVRKEHRVPFKTFVVSVLQHVH